MVTLQQVAWFLFQLSKADTCNSIEMQSNPVKRKFYIQRTSMKYLPQGRLNFLLQNCLKILYLLFRARENRKNSRSGPKLTILDRFQTPQNANKSVQQVCALNPIFPKPTNFHESMMSKKITNGQVFPN